MVDSFCLHKFIVIYQEETVPSNKKVLYGESCFLALDSCSLRILRAQVFQVCKTFLLLFIFFIISYVLCLSLQLNITILHLIRNISKQAA